jgi:hypothetical protein
VYVDVVNEGQTRFGVAASRLERIGLQYIAADEIDLAKRSFEFAADVKERRPNDPPYGATLSNYRTILSRFVTRKHGPVTEESAGGWPLLVNTYKYGMPSTPLAAGTPPPASPAPAAAAVPTKPVP